MYRPLEAIATRPGAKCLSVDPGTRTVYTVAPSGVADLSGGQGIVLGEAEEALYPALWQQGTLTLLSYVPSAAAAGATSTEDAAGR
jgi:hypothetical protein